MLEATQPIVAVKNIETPDERHACAHAVLHVVNLPGVTIARTVYQPGWKWSADVKPVVGTHACQAAHTGYIISGRLHARMDDADDTVRPCRVRLRAVQQGGGARHLRGRVLSTGRLNG